jgi:glycolate oxidase
MEVAKDQAQRERIWKGRKAAFAAMGRVSPNYYVQDGVVPRTKLPAVLRRIRALEARSGLRIGNVFHAGDGNLHPLICYDEAISGQAEHAEQVAAEILTYCIEAGGAITGEHGVGMDKRAYMAQMFGADDLDAMQLVRCAFDPSGSCNPGKIFPTPRLCGEVPGPYRPHPVEQAGLAERF